MSLQNAQRLGDVQLQKLENLFEFLSLSLGSFTSRYRSTTYRA